MPNKLISLLFITTLLFSCSSNTEVSEGRSVNDYEIHQLPNDLTQLKEKDIETILPLLGKVKVIAVSEGTHGMVEPFYFRNELIKLLVRKKKISAVALESGLVESKLAYDYVLGADIKLDSVSTYGMNCGFGDFSWNRELLIWLRSYNKKHPDEPVHFYGFDIPGCAPNPVLENNYTGFEHALNYFSKVNPEKYNEYKKQLETFSSLIRIKDNAEDRKPHFTDIDSLQWIKLHEIQEEMQSDLSNNKEKYISSSSLLDYDWAERAVVGAGQNLDFLYSIMHDKKHSPRERGLANNTKWISQRESKPILLFAHIAHLAKDISMKEGKMPYPQCGEYLGEELGDDYLVIGNFYSTLDYGKEGSENVPKGTIEELLSKKGNNYFMKLNKKDTKWNKEWAYAKPNSGGQAYMNPAKGVDIIFYTKVQHWMGE